MPNTKPTAKSAAKTEAKAATTGTGRKPNIKRAAKPAAKPAEAIPAKAMPFADFANYRDANKANGASPLIRTRTKAARVVHDKAVKSFTDRNLAALRDIHADHKRKAFEAGRYDAGILAALLTLGKIAHVAGTGTTDGNAVINGSYTVTAAGAGHC